MRSHYCIAEQQRKREHESLEVVLKRLSWFSTNDQQREEMEAAWMHGLSLLKKLDPRFAMKSPIFLKSTPKWFCL